jgi:hypothetical protein
MPLWGSTDNAANSTIFAAAQLKVSPNTANKTALFGNTTANAYITGSTIGQFGVDSNEITADGGKVAHTGWVLRTVGSGGRAGRVFNEVLVAGGISGDAEDIIFPDFTIRIITQPLANTANTTDGGLATFRVVANSTPNTTLSFQWTYANGDSIQAGANVGVTTSANLVINSSIETENTAFKVAVSATGANTVISSNAILTITT